MVNLNFRSRNRFPRSGLFESKHTANTVQWMRTYDKILSMDWTYNFRADGKSKRYVKSIHEHKKNPFSFLSIVQ